MSNSSNKKYTKSNLCCPYSHWSMVKLLVARPLEIIGYSPSSDCVLPEVINCEELNFSIFSQTCLDCCFYSGGRGGAAVTGAFNVSHSQLWVYCYWYHCKKCFFPHSSWNSRDHDLPHGSMDSMNHRHQHDFLMLRPSPFKGFSRKMLTTLDSLMGRDYRWISSRDMIFTSLTMWPTLVTGMNSLFLFVPQRAWWWPWPWPLIQQQNAPRMHRGLQGLDSWSSGSSHWSTVIQIGCFPKENGLVFEIGSFLVDLAVLILII